MVKSVERQRYTRCTSNLQVGAPREPNLTTRCHPCNGRRGDRCTDDERGEVRDAIANRDARSESYYATYSTGYG
jgi:hypothetical protein